MCRLPPVYCVNIVLLAGLCTEQDKALKGVPQDDLTNQELIRALRTDLGLTFNDFYMVLTDYDMRAKVSGHLGSHL